jgi:nicotinamide riboside transporter PnuC
MSYLALFFFLAGIAGVISALVDIRSLARIHYWPLLFSILGDSVIGAALIALALDQITSNFFFLLTFPAGLCRVVFRHKYRAEVRRRANAAG